MPLELPNLDDRTYDDLLKEALSLIPTYAPEWTNHNPSDPGIALIELFAHLSEMLLYRLNRVTDANILTFLTLLNGPDWQPTQDLGEEVQLAVVKLRTRYRAVTQEDYQLLSTVDFNAWLTQTQQNIGQIQRAHCVVERNLALNQESDRRQPAPGHVSVIILPTNGESSANELGPQPDELGPQPTGIQRQTLWNYLDERRTLTTRLHVVGAIYAPVSAEILVVCYADALANILRLQISEAIRQFLSPLPVSNSANNQGWSFGRDVYVSEFYELLEKLEGVDYLPDIFLSSQCQPADKNCVPAETIWNKDGEQVGLRLYEHHLPANRIRSEQLVIVAKQNIQVVQLEITITPIANTNISNLKQRLKTEIRNFLQLLRSQPNPSNTNLTLISKDIPNQIRLTRLQEISQNPIQYSELDSKTLNLQITGVQQINSLNLSTIIIKPTEIIDLRLQIQVQGE